MQKIIPHWLIIAVLAGILNVLILLTSQSIGGVVILVAWLVRLFSYPRKEKWTKDYLLFSSIVISLTMYVGLLLICNITSSWVCNRNFLLLSILASSILSLEWLALSVIEWFIKQNKQV